MRIHPEASQQEKVEVKPLRLRLRLTGIAVGPPTGPVMAKVPCISAKTAPEAAPPSPKSFDTELEAPSAPGPTKAVEVARRVGMPQVSDSDDEIGVELTIWGEVEAQLVVKIVKMGAPWTAPVQASNAAPMMSD